MEPTRLEGEEASSVNDAKGSPLTGVRNKSLFFEGIFIGGEVIVSDDVAIADALGISCPAEALPHAPFPDGGVALPAAFCVVCCCFLI